MTLKFESRREKLPLKISYTKANTFLTCRYLYGYNYLDDLTPRKKSEPPQVGDIVHRLRQLWFKNELTINNLSDTDIISDYVMRIYPENAQILSEEIAYKSAKLFLIYLRDFMDDELAISSPEIILENEYIEPATQVPFILYARLDALTLTPDGRPWRDELKVSAKTDNLYLNGLKQGLQFGISHWLLDDLYGEKIKGTVFNLIVNKSVPEAKRSMIPYQSWRIEWAKQAVYGVVRDIVIGDYYPSLQCTIFRGCDFEPLCKSDSPATRETFYQSRKEVMIQQKSVEWWDEDSYYLKLKEGEKV